MAYTNVANVSSYLRTTIDATTTPSTSEVEQWIDEADSEIEFRTKQKFSVNTVADKIIPIDSDHGIVSASNFDNTGAYSQAAKYDLITIPNQKILTLDSVYKNNSSDTDTPDWEELTVGYGGDVILQDNNILVINSGLSLLRQNVGLKISYTYGDTDTPKFVQKISTRIAALEFIDSAEANNVSSGGGSIRVGDIELQESGAYTGNFINSTQLYIDEKIKQLGIHNCYLV